MKPPSTSRPGLGVQALSLCLWAGSGSLHSLFDIGLWSSKCLVVFAYCFPAASWDQGWGLRGEVPAPETGSWHFFVTVSTWHTVGLIDTFETDKPPSLQAPADCGVLQPLLLGGALAHCPL